MAINDPFDAAELARAAAIEDAVNNDFVGALVSVDTDESSADGNTDARIATYLFEAALPGYKGWRWAVSLAKVDSASPATVCDVVLLPGEESLIAPEWVAYKDRILPGDVGVGDIIPTSATDERLVPGYAALPGDEELDPSQLFEFGRWRGGRLRGRHRHADGQPLLAFLEAVGGQAGHTDGEEAGQGLRQARVPEAEQTQGRAEESHQDQQQAPAARGHGILGDLLG